MELVVVGTGKMARAIIAGAVKNHEVIVIGRNTESLKEIEKKYKVSTKTLHNYNMNGKNIIFCVKPYALVEASKNLYGKAASVISVLAGTSIKDIKINLKATSYIRIMPNLAATYKKSMTIVTGDESFKEQSLEICSSIGSTLWVGSEKELDIATPVAGSGPAFLALVAEALSDASVKEGLKREDADTIVRGLFEGFAPLIKNQHPALLKDGVMSPGGTTAAGYGALEDGAVRASFMRAVHLAYERTKK
ncbi:MAG TPA: pyrroline-5-carboxylate reductase [Campylobacterales bacterium]|nr:pyrroline-5-carboxylate reductase [Campylobacterales bacterium]